MNRKDWFDMINQELDDLKRISDRKATKESIKPYQAFPKKRNKRRVNFVMDKAQIAQKCSQNVTNQFLNYTFGIDIKEDFTNLFSIFSRVAKAKLDNMVLSEFASHEYVDILFSRASNNFSTQITANTEMYFSQINTRMNALEKKFNNFQVNIDYLLTQLETRIFEVKTQIYKLRNRHQIEVSTPANARITDARSSSQISFLLNPQVSTTETNILIRKAHGLDDTPSISDEEPITPRL